MSCPDWRALAAAREADPLHDPSGLAEARAHMTDCPDCRRGAAAADPLLVFQRLRQPARADHDAGGDLAMQDAVMALVRASRVAPDSTSANTAAATVSGGPRRRVGVARVAAVLLATTLLSLSGARGPRVESAADSSMAKAAEAQALSLWIEQAAELAQPAVEELDRPGARIYELPHADLAVVMIVDASLDV